MAKARETYEKNERETKSIAIDVGGSLAVGETVNVIGAPTQTDANGGAIAGGDEVTISGVAANAAEINEPGRRLIPIGEGIQFFAAAGKATVGRYLLTIPYTTSKGQDLDATVELKVK